MSFDDGESESLWIKRNDYKEDMKNQFTYGLASGAGLILLIIATVVWIYH